MFNVDFVFALYIHHTEIYWWFQWISLCYKRCFWRILRFILRVYDQFMIRNLNNISKIIKTKNKWIALIRCLNIVWSNTILSHWNVLNDVGIITVGSALFIGVNKLIIVRYQVDNSLLNLFSSFLFHFYFLFWKHQ